MQYYMPVKVYEELNAVKNHAMEMVSLGRKAMIVIGSSSAKKNGSLEDVLEVLNKFDISHILFDSVEANPSVETVMKAREIGVSEQVDFVIGIGGGSPMDAAKAIALMIQNSKEDETLLFDSSRSSSALPLVLIPTTCGTGSEVTAVSVLTRHDQKTKQSVAHKIFAKLALIDGRYLESAPRSVINNTAIDALSHLWESAIGINTTPYSRMFTDAGLREWAKNKQVLLGEEERTGERNLSLLRASAMAGMAIAHGGTCLPHGFSYPVTYDTGMEHGKACGYFQAGYLAAAPKSLREELLSLAGFQSLDEWMLFYKKVCDAPELSDALLDRSIDVLSKNTAKLSQVPFELHEGDLRRMAYFMKN